jgi:Flp pilus assembly pilin Flp
MIPKKVENTTVSERGASIVDYVLLAALVAVLCLAAVRMMGRKVSTQFSTTSECVGTGCEDAGTSSGSGGGSGGSGGGS